MDAATASSPAVHRSSDISRREVVVAPLIVPSPPESSSGRRGSNSGRGMVFFIPRGGKSPSPVTVLLAESRPRLNSSEDVAPVPRDEESVMV